ncbi:MAG TPA: hypothetical protein VLJ11_01160 [Bryobacteraceae bacterium]|nr:hypothetical protein [Bryobacteraceae bacterium]
MRQVSLIALCGLLTACHSTRKEAEKYSQVAKPSSESGQVSPQSGNYSKRVGLAMNSSGKTCLVVHTADVADGSTVTLIIPASSQRFVQGKVTGKSKDTCPFSSRRDNSVVSYDVDVDGSVPKMTPLIAVLGSGVFAVDNKAVTVDMKQDGNLETFHACSTGNEIRLTAWSGKNPLSGTMTWHASFPEMPGSGKASPCTGEEMTAP